ncbi:MAG: hypothetical protein EB023_02150 [Flavobacteriia bacterium]|nr:hypothetical protein [Flavobacteriia bacterium]
MNKIHILLVFWFLHSGILAQGKRIKWENFNNRANWSNNRLEAQVGFCATQFTGDLGGASGPGKDYSTKDMNPQATGKGVQAAFKFRFNRYFATKTECSYFELKGSDAYTDNPRRNSRNLSFQSTNFDFSQRLEFIFLAQEFNGKFYRLTSKSRQKGSNFQLYTFAGMGFATYNPKANFNGTLVELRPLKTEGQAYGKATFIIPFGFGLRFGLTKYTRIGIEATCFKTFTDYMDDVSGFYPELGTLTDPAAQYLSNPSKTPELFPAGSRRGDVNQKDAYYRLGISLIFNLKRR